MNLREAIKAQWDRFARKELTVEQYIKNINWIKKNIKKKPRLEQELKALDLI